MPNTKIEEDQDWRKEIMYLFQVWAPNASSVDVLTGDQAFRMTAAGGGWWEAAVDSAEYGDDYTFSVDGGAPLPDPRSMWQPQGVHGPSRLLTPEFRWTDEKWNPPPLTSAVIYELHVGTFTPEGTFEAAITKLDELVDLGVTHLEIMPVAECSGEWGWGYDGVDLFAPHHACGGPLGLKKLVNACHQRGLAVLLDVVYNHFGPSGNYVENFGPYTVDKYHTPWGRAVNLDGRFCNEVRAFFIDNALMWLREYHFDGLRLDAVHALIDNGATHFLEELAGRVDALSAELGRHLTLIAESDLNNPRIVRSRAVGGYGIDAQWSDDFHHALHTVLTGERSGYYADFGSIAQLAKALRQSYVYDGCFSICRERPHGRAPVGLSGRRFLAYIQNHDQVGNRARGERIGHLVSPARARIAAALVMTSPFVPLIFQGEEWSASTPFLYFAQHDDPDLAHAVSTGRKREFAAFGWRPEEVPDPQDPATFQASKLNWDERAKTPHAEMLDWYRALIRLRRSSPDLLNDDLSRVSVDFNEDEQWLMSRRGRIAVVCNLSNAPRRIPVSPESVLLASHGSIRTDSGRLLLPAESVAIVQTRRDAAECTPTETDVRTHAA